MRSDLPSDLSRAQHWKPRVYGVGQIRSYVLDRDLVKDLRTNVVSTPARVLNGELDEFIRAALLLRVSRPLGRVVLEAG